MNRDIQGRLGAAFAMVDRKESGEEASGPVGFEVAAHFGSPDEEVRTLQEGCGLADASWQGRLEIVGPDRLRFANAYLTCDVKGLAVGSGTYGFFTSPQGRILSDAVVLALEDRLWLRVAPGQEEKIADHLRKYILADRVEVHLLAETRCFTLAGPKAGAVFGAGVVDALEAPWHHVQTTVAGVEARVERTSNLGVEAYTLWAAGSEADLLSKALLHGEGILPVGFEALETVRVEAGIPRWGRDFSADNFPQETGLEAVSYTKGCYLGQEIVARIHYRGGVQKSLRGLYLEGDVASGAVLLSDGRPAGVATSAISSSSLGRRIGLSILHKRAAEPGTLLEVQGGGSAEVVELPFPRG